MLLSDSADTSTVDLTTEPDLSGPAGDEPAPNQLDKVEATATTVERPLSRREKIEQERKALTAKVDEALKKADKADSLEKELEKERGERERMRVDLDALRNQRQAAPPPTADGGEDDLDPQTQVKVSRIVDGANEKLKGGDVAGWQRDMLRANNVIAQSAAERTFSRQQAAQPQMHPAIAHIRSQNMDLLAHPAAEAVLRAEDALLPRTMGEVERVQKAYEKARERIFGTKTPTKREPTRSERGALSGAPTGRSGAGGGRQLKLPSGMDMAEVRRIAKASEMTPEKYLKRWAELHPEDVVDED